MEDLKAELEPHLTTIRSGEVFISPWDEDRLTRFLPEYIFLPNNTAQGYLASLIAAVSLQDLSMGRKVYDRLEMSAVLALRFGETKETLEGKFQQLGALDSEKLAKEARDVLAQEGFVLDQENVIACENSFASCSEQLMESVSRVLALEGMTSQNHLYLINLGYLISQFAGRILGKVFLRNFEFHKGEKANKAAELLYEKGWCLPYEALSSDAQQTTKPCGDHSDLTFVKLALSSEELALHEILKNITHGIFKSSLEDIDASAYEIAQLFDQPYAEHFQMPYQAPLIQEKEGCSHANYFKGPFCHNSSLDVQEKMKIKGTFLR